MSRPRVRRTVASIHALQARSLNAAMDSRLEPSYARIRGVERDQVDLEHARRLIGTSRGEQPRERDGLLVAVVDAGEHDVLDEDAAALAGVEGAAGVDDVGERVALVDRHELGAERFVGRVEREGEAQRHVGFGEPFDAGDPADRGDGGAAVGDADVGEAFTGGENVVEVEHRLAHAHEDAVVDGLDAAEMKRLVEDLRGGEVACEFHAAGGAEGAGEGQPDCEETQIERRESR